MITKEQAYKTIKKLIERFDDHIDEYKKGNYNETQIRAVVANSKKELETIKPKKRWKQKQH